MNMVLNKKLVLFLTTLVLSGNCWAKCGPLDRDLSKTVFYSAADKTLHVKNTVIANQVADKILDTLTSVHVETIQFECILGGLSKAIDKIYPHLRSFNVEVTGACNSGCAVLALSAKQLSFKNNGDIKFPSSMMIHASYDVQSLKASEAGLLRLGLYTQRLKAIPQDVLTEVLTEKRVGNYGLVISYNTNEQLQSKDTSVFLCQPYPDQCKPIGRISLNDLQIKKLP
jgi:hypothetical protein